MSEPDKPLERWPGQKKAPAATYRLQFNRAFTFAQAREIADYLRDLGVSDVYASPLFQAGPQSTHGYDICRFDQLNPALGSRSDFDRFTFRLRELGLGLLLDIVPNHMGNDLSNSWWAEVLRHGRSSPYASYFDIDWRPAHSDLHDKILLPVLEDHYSAVLESGKLQLVYRPEGFAVAYHDTLFPLRPETETGLLEEVDAGLMKDSQALAAVCKTYEGLPGQPRSFDKLHRLLVQQHYRLAFWRIGPEEINYRRFFDVTQLVSVRMELPAVFSAAHRLVSELLANGQVTGLRIDHPDGLWDPKEYFRRLQLLFLAATEKRDSKPDGEKLEPAAARWLDGQLFSLEEEEIHRPVLEGERNSIEAPRSDPLAGKSPRPPWPLYVVAEKILSKDERLRRDWPVEGTTGYDFLSIVNGLFVDGANAGQFDALYDRFTGNQLTFDETVYLGKKRVLNDSLPSEWRALTHRLKRLALATRYGQDFTFGQLQAALGEVIAAFPVYRSYVAENSRAVVPAERACVEEAIAKAKARCPGLDLALLNFIQDLLLLRNPIDFDEEATKLSREFVLRFQQLTGPVTAKGLEDTAFYNYNRLVSLNDVGGDPGQFGFSVDDFHRHNLLKAEQWPHALLATATHDTKRGEDVRARLNVLSEIPGEWASALERWSHANQDRKQTVDGCPAPHPNDEYLLYQTLLGAWPFPQEGGGSGAGFDHAAFRDRITAYMLKAAKEAKARTSWTRPNVAYEQALQQFIAAILDPESSARFLADLQSFQRRMAFFGVSNSLSQLVLKLTSPGVPDLYQGTELWDLNLVDPDNRRPVDYEMRRRLLRELVKQSGQIPRPDLVRRLWDERHTGQLKLYLLWRALRLRRQRRALFSDGAYVPVRSLGPQCAHVCAFARVFEDQVTLTVVPRLTVSLTQGKEERPLGDSVWQNTVLELPSGAPVGEYCDVFTGEIVRIVESSVALSQVLRLLPVALLERIPNSH